LKERPFDAIPAEKGARNSEVPEGASGTLALSTPGHSASTQVRRTISISQFTHPARRPLRTTTTSMLYSTHAMAARWEFVFPPQPGHTEDSLRTIAEEAGREVALAEQCLSIFRRDSHVSYINSVAHARPVALNSYEWEAFTLAREVWEKSSRAFDITVAPLMKRLGLHDPSSSASDAPIFGMQHVVLDEPTRTIRFALPGIAIDMGSLAKGFGLTCVLDVLRDNHITSAFIHAGTSSSLAIGTRPDGQPWRVSLGTLPDDPAVELVNQSLSVSGRRSRPAELGAQTTRSHILDPRTPDYLDTSDLDLVAVVDPSPLRAEAWSTAALLNGSSGLPLDIPLFAKDDTGRWIVRSVSPVSPASPQQSEHSA